MAPRRATPRTPLRHAQVTVPNAESGATRRRFDAVLAQAEIAAVIGRML